MRAAIYARVSTPGQQQTQTIQQQLERLQQYVQKQGWRLEPDHIYQDDGYSGAKLARPGLDHLRDRAMLAEFDVVVVTAPDRLARNYVHQMLVIDELKKRQVVINFLERPMSDDPHDRLLLQIRGAVAEYEQTLIADRMRRGRLAKMRAGKLLPWIRVPYGFRVDPEHPRDPDGVCLDEAEGAILVQMFNGYLEPGATLSGIAKRLTDLHILTPGGKRRWTSCMVRRLLTNTAYTGIVYGNRLKQTPSTQRQSALQQKPPGHTLKTRPEDDWIAIPVPAIISGDIFDRVQAKLSRNRQQSPRNNTRYTYLLRGLLSCGLCRLAAHGRTVHQKYHYYVCRGHTDRLRYAAGHRCTARFIPSQQLDELVWHDLCHVLMHPDLITHALERAHGGHWLPQQLQAQLVIIDKALLRLEHQKQRLLDAYIASVIELDELKRKRANIDAKSLALTAQRNQLVATTDERLALSETASSIEAVCAQIQPVLEQADFAQKRQLVELLVDRVVVTDARVEIRYVVPTTPDGPQVPFSRLCIDYRNHQRSVEEHFPD